MSFPPSPPCSTSLPEHFSFSLTGSDPPPTDGPNTRDRLSRGLLPKSGRTSGPDSFPPPLFELEQDLNLSDYLVDYSYDGDPSEGYNQSFADSGRTRSVRAGTLSFGSTTSYELGASSLLASSPNVVPEPPNRVLAPPLSPATLRRLTPVSSALRQYDTIPIPTSPPPQLSAGSSRDGKKFHGRKVSIGHIPRPRNPFILFRSHAINSGMIPRTTVVEHLDPRDGTRSERIVKVDHKNISQLVGKVWKELSEEQKKVWERLADKEKREHAIKFPDYKFKPRQPARKRPETNTSTSTVTKGKIQSRRVVDKDAKREDIVVNEDHVVDAFTVGGDYLVSQEKSPPSRPTLEHSTLKKQNKSRPTPFTPSSPSSSISPSPRRMAQYHPYSRPPPNSSSPVAESLSRMKHHTSARASNGSRHKKSAHYATAGLGITFSQPSPSRSTGTSMTPPKNDVPLFRGVSDSRHFSLGRFELNRGSTSGTSRIMSNTQGLMDRSLASRQRSEESDREPDSGKGRTWGEGGNNLVLDSKRFLYETGLATYTLNSEQVKEKKEVHLDETDTIGDWETLTEFSTSTVPTTIISSTSSTTSACGSRTDSKLSTASGSDPMMGGFHFGNLDLFSTPPPALFR
ncbi:HMG-box domain-containing protein [Sporobolomyces koalae]|uniref:HMG-box domain-containing protein n=1 Tax=Sporobolomyces koalae TaxID=500713 RepID=UPI00316C31FA